MRPTGRRMRFLAAPLLVLALALAACDDSSDTDQQIAELEQQVSDLEAELETTSSALEEANDANAELEEQLAATQAELTSTSDELGTTQAELADAQARLAAVGEVVLEDGTYVGQVLGAKQNPYQAIIFDAGGLFRVAQVADGATITAGGDDLSLSQFGRLLSSTDPDDVKLANGNYQVIVRDGLVTSIRKSNA
jgi:ABC-type transporter Mla subunit MlaD